jgi:hypothetical protein
LWGSDHNPSPTFSSGIALIIGCLVFRSRESRSLLLRFRHAPCGTLFAAIRFERIVASFSPKE